MPKRRKLAAYTLPLATFLALLALNGALKKIDNLLWLSSAEYWLYPTQAILCGGLLIWFRRKYDFDRLRRPFLAGFIAAVVFLVWISPPCCRCSICRGNFLARVSASVSCR